MVRMTITVSNKENRLFCNSGRAGRHRVLANSMTSRHNPFQYMVILPCFGFPRGLVYILCASVLLQTRGIEPNRFWTPGLEQPQARSVPQWLSAMAFSRSGCCSKELVHMRISLRPSEYERYTVVYRQVDCSSFCRFPVLKHKLQARDHAIQKAANPGQASTV